MAKGKITGFTRLLIFLIIFLPLAFVGASYINGEDPIDQVKTFLGQKKEGTTTTQVEAPPTAENTKVNDLEKRILILERDLAVAEEKLARCQMEQQQNQ